LIKNAKTSKNPNVYKENTKIIESVLKEFGPKGFPL